MTIRDPRDSDASTERSAPQPSAEPLKSDDDLDADDLDLDLEELGDGDRLKEGFTGQER